MKTIFKYSLVLFLLSTFCSINLNSQSWENVNTPFGGNVKKIIGQNNLLFALTDFRLYISSDEGMNWVEGKSKIDFNGVYDLISHRNHLFATIYQKGVIRSSDNGDSWYLTNTGISNININNIESDGDNLYILQYIGTPLMSTNNGDNWIKPKQNFIDFDKLNGLKIFRDSNSSFLGYNKGNKFFIYSKKNLDSVWKNISIDSFQTNTTSTINMTNIFSKDSIILISFSNNTLLRSTNYGNSWQKTKNNALYQHKITSFLISDSILFASAMYNDFSDGWRSEKMYLFKSTNLGDTWDSIFMENRVINSLYKYKNIIFSANSYKEGLIASIDNFKTFEKRNNGINCKTISSVITNKSALVLKYFVNSGSLNGIFRYYFEYYLSLDDGNNWKLLNDNIMNTASDMISIGKDFYLNTSIGLYKSTDNCTSWNQVGYSSFNNNLYFTGSIMLAQDLFSIYYSSDFGYSWTAPSDLMNDNSINSFTGLDSNYYLLTTENLYRSNTDLNKWDVISTNTVNTNSYIKDVLYFNNYLFCSTNYYAFRTKTDSFSVKLSLYSNNGTGFNFKVLKSNKHLFLNRTKVFDSFELFISDDNGDNWKLIQNNLYSDRKNSIIVHKDKTYMTSTYTGLWRTDLNETGIETEVKKEDKLIVSPNPSSSFISIDISKTELSSNLLVTYSITDIEGKVLSTFEKTDIQFSIQTLDLPNGTYYLRAEQGSKCYLKIISIQK